MKIVRSAVAGSLESSDAMVTVTPCGEIEIEIESVVMRQFGPAIEAAAKGVLEETRVSGAHVRIQDKGALDCTIRARVETALRRAGEE